MFKKKSRDLFGVGSSFVDSTLSFFYLFSPQVSKFSSKQATENDHSAKKPQKVNSILCQDCEGNGEKFLSY